MTVLGSQPLVDAGSRILEPSGGKVRLASLVAFAAAIYVTRQLWNGTAGGATSVAVMAGLGAVIGAIAGAWYAMRR